MFDAPAEPVMRTTIAIGDDVLAAAKAIACRRTKPLVRSSPNWHSIRRDRRSLRPSETVCRCYRFVNQTFPIVTPEIVKALRDELP